MTNLYDFLRRILADPTTKITADDCEWIKQFIQEPDYFLHFKARKVGQDQQGEDLFAQDYAIKGDGPDVFQLLTEAMLANAHFARLIIMAANFYNEHVPECTDCRAALINAMDEQTDWNFITHKIETNGNAK